MALHYKPQLRCPSLQSVIAIEGRFNVSCDVLVNPIVPDRNITWEMYEPVLGKNKLLLYLPCLVKSLSCDALVYSTVHVESDKFSNICRWI